MDRNDRERESEKVRENRRQREGTHFVPSMYAWQAELRPCFTIPVCIIIMPTSERPKSGFFYIKKFGKQKKLKKIQFRIFCFSVFLENKTEKNLVNRLLQTSYNFFLEASKCSITSTALRSLKLS